MPDGTALLPFPELTASLRRRQKPRGYGFFC